MKRYINLLCHSLGTLLSERTVLLLVDMAPCHIHHTVFDLARRRGLRMLLVPAGLTGMLQPLDTHVFQPFRAKLRELWVECRSVAEDGEVSFLTWARLVIHPIQEVVVGKPWRAAFERTGFLAKQALLSPKILKALAWESCPKIAAGPPPHGQASGMFPRRCQANVAAWVEWRATKKLPRIQTLD